MTIEQGVPDGRTVWDILQQERTVKIVDSGGLDAIERAIIGSYATIARATYKIESVDKDLLGEFRFEEPLSALVRPDGFNGSLSGTVERLELGNDEIENVFGGKKKSYKAPRTTHDVLAWNLSLRSSSNPHVGILKGMVLYNVASRANVIYYMPVIRRHVVELGSEKEVRRLVRKGTTFGRI